MAEACMFNAMLVELTWDQMKKWVLIVFCSLKAISPEGDLLSCYCKSWGPCKTKAGRGLMIFLSEVLPW